MRIIRMTRGSKEFYPTLGPYLSRREIVAELGAPVWDDDDKEWFVAKRGRMLLGFSALRLMPKHTALVSAYVLPKHRGKGVYRALLETRLSRISGVARAVATKPAKRVLARAGFKAVGKRGRFTVMEKTVGKTRKANQ